MGWDPTTMTVDGVHPNATGEPLLAQNMADALAQLGFLTAPSVYHGPVSWTPAPVVTVRGRRGAVGVVWGAAQVAKLRMSDVRLSWRPFGGTWREGSLVGTRHHLSGTIGHLRPGIYQVRLVPVRKWMLGDPGPAVRVVVR